MSHQDTLVTAASVIAGFGSALIAFRLQRELDIEERNEKRPEGQREEHWFPASDWLLVVSNVSALCFVVVPLVALDSPSNHIVRMASAVCAASAILLAGYIPSILAHYQFFYGLSRQRSNPTFWEGVFILFTGISALIALTLIYKA